ncbi:hypothetical protein EV385_0243 [Krasilnikovia cinnamomea]|uniref:Uncharacterized protein n=1 Tax=Krasilnikovia cinnamomea TaxID=349313 RepID=A0A4V2G6G5_9ACTN|nr:hypothetical protein [Krasilnikovia cinnamomea]RZU48526.1 hypothetical protein EV385_0243 [Krasilnikovia cinnamomea]
MATPPPDQQPSDRNPPGPAPDERPERTAEDVLWSRVRRRQEKIRAEVQRNRAGGHRIPTWVLATLLGLLLLGWLYLIVTR